jgi:hypothetical protein
MFQKQRISGFDSLKEIWNQRTSSSGYFKNLKELVVLLLVLRHFHIFKNHGHVPKPVLLNILRTGRSVGMYLG